MRSKRKTSKTATNGESNGPDGSKTLTMKQRLFSKSRSEVADDVEINSTRTAAKERVSTKSRSDNGILPSIKPQNQTVLTRFRKENGDVLCTRQSMRQQSVRQRVLATSSRSDDTDTLSTRHSMLSGPLDLDAGGQNVGYTNDR